MTISITTTATGGHLILYLINSNNIRILELHDSDSRQCMLANGTYRLEWHVWSPHNASYSIQASISPPNPGFPPFNFQRNYQGSHQDMGGFYFTI